MIKIKNSKLVYVSILALSLAACAAPTPREIEVAKRQEIINIFDAKLAALKLTIEETKVKLTNVPKEARAKCQADLDALITHFDKASEGQRQLKEELKDAEDAAWDNGKAGVEKISDEFAALQKEIRDTDRQEIINGFEAKLADLELRIEDGKKKMAGVSSDVREKFESELSVLNEHRNAAKVKLAELKQGAKDGATDAWHQMKAGMDKAWSNIQAAGQRLFE